MGLRLPGVRSGEGRDTAGAFVTLFGLMAGHSLLETARDALFLAKIAPIRLPLVYLAIAGLAIGITRVARAGGRPGRLALATWVAGGAAVTLAFWTVVGRAGDWSLYALYVWSGLLSTLLIVRFWLLAGEIFTVSQAKRLFAVVGTGSILGAVAGSAVAQAIALRLEPRHMLLAAAAVLMLTAAAPALLRRPPEETSRRAAETDPDSDLAATLRGIWNHPYMRRVAGLVLISAVALTFADLMFKSALAAELRPGQLAWAFALIYMIINILSLLVQLLLVGWMTRNVGINRVLAFLPILLLSGSLWFLLGGGALAALLIKGFDGTLRHSLHRTALEVLSVPLPTEWRRRLKGFVDVAGQRGGQALASLFFLAVASFGAVGASGSVDAALGAVLATLCVGWILLAAGLKRHYFDLFRSTLEEGATRTRMDFPDLDLASLETLMAALSSPDEAEVRAALDLLAEENRGRLVPALILYHPSPKVVVKALELFERMDRVDHRRIVATLLERPEPEVRTAALLALPPGETDSAALETALDDDSPDVRATALVGLYCCEDVHPRIPSILETLLHAGSPEAKRALAHAIGRRPDPKFDGLLISLAAQDDPGVGREVARAMRSRPRARYLPSLRDLLARREAREEARRTLVAIGDEAMDYLAEQLADETLPLPVRRHLPRTVGRLDPPRAGTVLLQRLTVEPDGAVRFKILRALGYLRARNPGLPLDRKTLTSLVETTLEQTFRLIDWRVTLRREVERTRERETPVRSLIIELLARKEERAIERLFRLFSLLYPREDFKRIHRGVGSTDRKARASGRELLENVLKPPLRDAVVGLLDDVPDERRLAAGRRFHETRSVRHADILRALLEQENTALRCLVAYHVAELGMKDLRDELADLCDAAVGAMEESFRSALDMLDDPRKEKAFVVPVR